jgi:hypothetical protein
MKDTTMSKLGKGEFEGKRIKVRTENVRLGAVYVRVESPSYVLCFTYVLFCRNIFHQRKTSKD